MTLRNLIEKLSRGIVLKRTMPAALGGRTIYVSPEGGLRYWKPSLDAIDPMLSNVVQGFIKEGDVIWDIGANVGFFSLAALSKSKTGKCLAVEPDIWLCNILRKTQRENLDCNLDILPVAIGSEMTLSKFVIANRSRSTNHLAAVEGSTQTGGIRRFEYVLTMSLDDLLDLYPKPDFLKIDTEGAELLTLIGGHRVLESKPVVLIEVFNNTYYEVVELLLKYKYRLYGAEKLPDLVPIDQVPTENILAIPH